MDRDGGGIGSQAKAGGTGGRSRKKSAKPAGNSDKKQRSSGVKLLLWILRKSIVPLIMLIMLIVGLYVGYVVIGKGPEDDVFSWSTWQHLYDLVFAES
ncbi:DNA-directed RNA polymerase subunit beta [compost metagenome]